MKNPAGQFIRLPYELARHDAFRTASLVSKAVLIELWLRFNGKNNGDLFLACRDGARLLRVKPHSIGAALLELEARGFIVRTSRGSKAKHIAPRWRITALPYNGAAPTNDWVNWAPSVNFAANPVAEAAE